MSNKTENVKDFIWAAVKNVAKYAGIIFLSSLAFKTFGIGELSTGALAGIAIGTAVLDTVINLVSVGVNKAANAKTKREAEAARTAIVTTKDAEITRLNGVIAARDATISTQQSQITTLQTEITTLKGKIEGDKTKASDIHVHVREMRLIVRGGSVDVAAATSVLDDIERDARDIRA